MPRFDPTTLVYGLSLAVHVAAGWMLSRAEPPAAAKIEVVALQTVVLPKPKPPAPPKPAEPPPPPTPAAPAPRRVAPPAAAPSAPPPSNTPAVADLGFALGGGGPGGMAIAPPSPAGTTRQAVKALVAPAASEGGCAEAEVKAKATSMPRPAYTEEATAAGIEGKVRVQLTVDADGTIGAAQVLEGLGHGLDEAAVAAVRGATFTPATRCGKAVPSSFTVAIRFAL
ncbi:MAG: TonB family protein [Myxococcota bacterium]